MMPEDCIPLLEEFLEQVSLRNVRARDGAKVVIEGAFCEQPPIGLLEVIESAGCMVKDDDLMIAWRLFPEDVRLNGDPLGSLADACLKSNIYTSVRHDRDRPRTEGLMRRVADAGAEAGLFAPAKLCEPALLDYVLFRWRLEQAAMPHLKRMFTPTPGS